MTLAGDLMKKGVLEFFRNRGRLRSAGPLPDESGSIRNSVAVTVVAALLIVVAPVTGAVQEEEELARKLVRQTTGEGEDDLMTKIMRMMSEGARRLEVTFDAGAETQALQKEIIKELDNAIAVAAQNTKRKPQSNASRSDRRTASRPRSDGSRQPGAEQRSAEASSEPGQDATTAPGGDGVERDRDVELKERRRAWGNLPQRDRDEVIEGMNEAVLPRFREWVERYYRSLQGGPEDQN
ncbi:MAG: hypothetical protein KJ057_02630 [Phycisphaerae bacterium]|nr:hypothetical protein [Planctomycetia bacterium]MCL4717347.1 hypothetical protein [Phycisphaerae bacterium]